MSGAAVESFRNEVVKRMDQAIVQPVQEPINIKDIGLKGLL